MPTVPGWPFDPAEAKRRQQVAMQALDLQKPERSLFLDGEIALMMAMRRVVEEEPSYRGPLAERVETMVGRMKACPVMCCESYPDECWLFCNTVALAAIRTADHLDGTDNSGFLADWLRTARSRLVDGETGMLVSSFRLDGTYLDGPEGSTIWMASHCLRVVDEDFARDQYVRARREIARSFLGFGYAREWPESWRGPEDVDSGPTIPVLGASAGASGLAFLGAASFGDRDYYRSLLASIEFGGFPVRRGGTLRYSASNQVGDAVLLYSMVRGPVWERISKGAKGAKGGGRE